MGIMILLFPGLKHAQQLFYTNENTTLGQLPRIVVKQNRNKWKTKGTIAGILS